MNRPPSAEEQLVFLTKLQRLFAEGDFTATYKFALLIALAELAVERSGSDGDSDELGTRQIALKFIELYWKQSFEYAAGLPGTRPGVLVQNQGAQAAVINAIRSFRESKGVSTLAAARTHPAFTDLVSEVAGTVSAQPLNFLQNFGGDTDPFLYVRGGRGRIRLQPGVAYCLQRFQPLIQQLARSHWVDHLKRNHRNTALIGEAGDLEDFLFSTSRATLLKIGQALRALEGSTCFYCRNALHEHEVDHFIPFSTYPRDLGHNFVLAHPTCNHSKSDTLASRDHLARWLERNEGRTEQLAEIAEEAGIRHDRSASHAIARWSYLSALDANALAWIRPKGYERVDASYLDILTARM